MRSTTRSPARFPGRITIAEDLRNNAAITAATGAGRRRLRRAVGRRVRPPDPRDADRARRRAPPHGAPSPTRSTHHYNGDPFQRVDLHRDPRRGGQRQARACRTRSPRATPAHFAAQKRSTLGAALMFTAPGIPMLFQGQEFLQGDWFQDTVPLDWDQSDDVPRHRPPLPRPDPPAPRPRRHHRAASPDGRSPSTASTRQQKVVAFHRWAEGGPGDDVVVVANFQPRAARGLPHRLPAARPSGSSASTPTGPATASDFTGLATGDVEAVEAAVRRPPVVGRDRPGPLERADLLAGPPDPVRPPAAKPAVALPPAVA